MQTEHPDLVPPDELAHGDFEMIVRRAAGEIEISILKEGHVHR